MKFGLSPTGAFGLDFFQVSNLKTIRDLGFTGAAPYIPDFETFSQAQCAEIKAACEETGLDLVELGKYMTNFISPDTAIRKASIEETKLALEHSAWMGCPVVIVGSGSLNPEMAWYDHKDNHSWRSFDFLVQSLKEVVKTAEDIGVDLALECHTYTALDSPERTRNVVDAVGSPALKVDLDPVNWITYATYWDNGPYLHHMFDLLGDVIMGGHAKDARQEDGLIVHLNETHAGDGNLNYGVYLTRLNQLDPDTYLVIEHTAPELVEEARDYILAEADKAGVSFAT
jgi:sugar phosphate isomerase/epimerase